MTKQRWWSGDSTEAYWLELTDRDDVGANLKAPLLGESGQEFWSYVLLREAKVGDIVFHYRTSQNAIIGVSYVDGPAVEMPILWGSRGNLAREKGIKPHERPGYLMPLAGYSQLASPLTLSTLRAERTLLVSLVERLSKRHGKLPLYFPFETTHIRPVRPMQGYGFKLPRDFVFAFPELTIANQVPIAAEPQSQLVEPARLEVSAKEPALRKARGQGFSASVEVRTAIELHAMRVASEFLAAKGYELHDVSRTRPYDFVAVKGAEELHVEVKGTTSEADSIFLTKNEVNHARQNPGKAVLLVVHGIEIEGTEGNIVVGGGATLSWWPWVVDHGSLEPLQFKYKLPHPQ